MVRWASGVTITMHTAVSGPSVAGAVSNCTPAARMSCVNTWPSWSSLTRPTNAVRTPSMAAPTTVLAADPPEHSTPGPRVPYSSCASTAPMSVMPPLFTGSPSITASSTWLSTSTIALPRASTSTDGGAGGVTRDPSVGYVARVAIPAHAGARGPVTDGVPSARAR